MPDKVLPSSTGGQQATAPVTPDPVKPKYRPLEELDKVSSYKADLDRAIQYAKTPVPAPGGYVPAPGVSDKTLAEYSDYKKKEHDALEAAKPEMEKVAQFIFGMKGEKVSKYTTKNTAGLTVLNPEKLQADVIKWNEHLGGGKVSQQFLMNEVSKIGMSHIVSPDLKWEIDAERRKAKAPTQADVDNGMREIVKGIDSEIQAALMTTKTNLKTVMNPILDERDSKIEELSGKYDLRSRLLKEQVIGDKIAQQSNERYQLENDLKDGVLNKRFDANYAQQQLAQYDKKSKSDMDMFMRNDLPKVMSDKLQPLLEEWKNEVHQTTKPFNDKVRELKNQSKKDYINLENKIKAKFEKQKGEFYSKLELQNQKAHEDIMQKAWDNVMKKRKTQEEGYANYRESMMNYFFSNGQTNAAAQVLGEFFGNSYAESFGNTFKGVGDFLVAQGWGGSISDWFQGKGSSWQEQFHVDKDNITGSSLLSPRWYAQSLGSMLGTATPGMIATAVGGAEAGAVIGAAMNSIQMGGEVYSTRIANGATHSEAADSMRDFIIKHLPISFASEYLTQRAFSSAMGGFQFIKGGAEKALEGAAKSAKGAFYKELISSSMGQGIQEPVENSLQAIAIDPTLSFSDDFFTIKNLQAGAEAFVDNAALLGMTHGAGQVRQGQINNGLTSLTAKLQSAKVPAISQQWSANLIMKYGIDRAKAMAAIDHDRGFITDNQLQQQMDEMDVIHSKVKDAKAFGLSKAETLAYVGYSHEADVAEAKLKQITDPNMALAAQEKVKALRKQANDVLNGTTKVGEINVGGIGTIAAPDTDAKKINEQMEEEAIERITEKQKEEEKAGDMDDADINTIGAIMRNKDNITGEEGHAIRDRIDDPKKYGEIVEHVKEQVATDEESARKQFGDEVVDSVKPTEPEPSPKNKSNESTQDVVGSTETANESSINEIAKEQASENPQANQEVSGSVSTEGDDNQGAVQQDTDRKLSGANTGELRQAETEQVSGGRSGDVPNTESGSTTVDNTPSRTAGAKLTIEEEKEAFEKRSREKVATLDAARGSWDVYKTLSTEKKAERLNIIESKLKQWKKDGEITEDHFEQQMDRVERNRSVLPEFAKLPKVSEEVDSDEVFDKDGRPKSKSIAIKLAENFEKFAKGNKLYSDPFLISSAVKTAALAAAKSLRAMDTIANAIKSAVKAVREAHPDEYKGWTDEKLESKLKDAFDQIGLTYKNGNPTKKGATQILQGAGEVNIDKAAERTTRAKGETDFRTMFYKRVQHEKNITKSVEDLQNEVAKYFGQVGSGLTKQRIARVMKTLADLSTANDEAKVEHVADVLERIDGIVKEQRYEKEIKDIEDLIEEFKGVVTRSRIMQPSIKRQLSGLQFPSPKLLSHMNDRVVKLFDEGFYQKLGMPVPDPNGDINQNMLTFYKTFVDEMVKAYGNTQGKRQATIAEARTYADRINHLADVINMIKQQRLEDKVSLLIDKGILPSDTTVEDYQHMQAESKAIEAEERSEERKQKKEADNAAYIKVVSDLQEELNSIADTHLTHPRAIEDAKNLASIDPRELSSTDLRQLNDLLNNVLVERDITGVGAFVIDKKIVKDKLKELRDPATGIKIRKMLKVFGKTLEGVHTFTNMLNSITMDERTAVKFRKIFMWDFEHGKNKVQHIMAGTKKHPGIADQFLYLIKQNDIKQENQDRIGIYQELNQTEPDMMNAMIDKLTIDGVERLSKFGKEHNNFRGDDMKDEALRNAKALQSLGVITDFHKDSDGVITVTKNKDFNFDNVKLSDAEMAAYEFTQQKYADMLADHEHVARSVFGVDFQPVPNYAPRFAIRFTEDTKPSQNTDFDQMTIFGELPTKLSVQPMNRMKERQKIAGTDRYYRIGFVDGFLNAYNQMLLAKHAGAGLRTTAKLVNSNEFGSVLAGNIVQEVDDKGNIKEHSVGYDGVVRTDENIKIFRDMVGEVVNDVKQAPYLYPRSQHFVMKAFKASVSHMIKTYLNSVTQLAKQYIPNLVQTALFSSTPASTFRALQFQIMSSVDPELNEKYNEFFSNFSGAFRTPMNNTYLDKYINTDPQWYHKAGNILTAANKPGEWALKTADKGAFNLSILAGYIDHQFKSGKLKSLSDFNLDEAIANFDHEAAVHAEAVASRVNKDSDKAYRAKLTKDGNGWSSFFVLQGFSMSAFAEFANAVRTMSPTSEATAGERRRAAGHAGGYIAQVAMFNMLKVWILKQAVVQPLAQSLLPMVTGVHARKDNEEEKRRKNSKMRWAIAADVLVGGLPSPMQNAAKVFVGNPIAETVFGTEKPFYEGSQTFGEWGISQNAGEVVYKAFTDAKAPKGVFKKKYRDAVDTAQWVRFWSVVLNSSEMFEVSNTMESEIRHAATKPAKPKKK